MKRKILTTLFFLSLVYSLNNYNLISKKNLFQINSNRNYERGTFLIILANADFYNRLSYNPLGYNFIDFKKTQGYNVEVFSFREGNDNIEGINGQNQEDLKNFLIDYYNQNSMLEYVLLIGDVNQASDDYNIPTFTIPSYNPPIVDDQTDYPYTFWGDNDEHDAYDPKFFIGRWSVSESADIQKLIIRNINYYTLKFGPNDIDGSYLNQALLVAGNYNGNPDAPSSWPVTPVWTTKWLKEELYQYGYSSIDTALFHQGNYDQGAEINPQIEDSFNEGIGVVNYRGWGDATGWHKPKFHLDDIGELSGNDKLPIVFSFVCNTGDFGNETQPFCFGEELITAGTIFNQKGAVAMIGPSDLDTDTRFNNVICGAMWDGLLENKVSELGPALYYGKTAILNEFEGLIEGTNPTDIPYFYHHVYGVLGDPSIPVWLKEPSMMYSEFDSNQSLEHRYISSIILDESGIPLRDVVGVVIKENEILGKGVSNQDGYLDIDLSNLELSSTVKLYLNKPQFMQKEYVLEFNSDDNSTLIEHEYTQEPEIDDYGYIFIDSNSGHNFSPTYEWIEINGLGDNLELIDDSSITIPIGFDFKFYGQDFNEITIGSNGWASFLPCLDGDELIPDCEVIDHFFNNSITFPIGPYALLAPFYDDLDDNVGTEPFNIYSYYDSMNHRFIVQWDNLANGENDHLCPNGCDKETFQLILLDPYYYVTESNDGAIIFQYKEVHDVDDHGSTVGIESPDKNQGVEYLFNYSYHSEASQLSSELSIIFSTQDSPSYLINGDINQDSILDILDIINLVNYIIGNDVLSDSQLEIADFNNDSLIDLFDIIQILQTIIRL